MLKNEGATAYFPKDKISETANELMIATMTLLRGKNAVKNTGPKNSSV